SFGVRTWVTFFAALCERSTEVRVTRLPPVLVRQAGMVSSFLGDARVESFFSPWCCLECDAESLQLHAIDAQVPDVYRCPECGADMEFAGLRDSYLSFRVELPR